MNISTIEQVLVGAFILVAIGMRVGEMWCKKGMERGATSMMWSFYALVAAAGVVYVVTALEFFLRVEDYHLVVGLIGMGLYGVSVFLRRAAIAALGRYWSLHIEIRQQHPLVNTGPYRWVRHPAYAAFVLELVGVSLAGNAWWALGVTGAVYGPLLFWRIQREEAALLAQLGEPYRVYRERTGRLTPRWIKRRDGAGA